MGTINVTDSRNLAADGPSWTWSWEPTAVCTAAMLIEERVRFEADRVRSGIAESTFYSEMRPGEDGMVDSVVANALATFRSGKLLLLVNDRQVADPEQEIDLSGPLEVTFLRLVPLKGG
jgi:hypothetical protein